MKLVIEIPEEEYQTYINHTEAILDSSIPLVHQDLLRAVINGTPLPKGHGRLIDADDLDITTITTDDYSGNEVLDIVLKEDIDNAPTIIESDKAGEGE